MIPRKHSIKRRAHVSFMMSLIVHSVVLKSFTVVEAQTLLPSNESSITVSPSTAPSSLPTAFPSTSPSSSRPSGDPSDFPTGMPTLTSYPTLLPTVSPSNYPTITARPTTTMSPTEYPSSFPSTSPSDHPTYIPSAEPTFTIRPSSIPSVTIRPSELPTDSPAPTSSPSLIPTSTPNPTNDPTISPSQNLSTFPSFIPTPHPSFPEAIVSNTFFSQRFINANGGEFLPEEKLAFEDVMQSFTLILAAQIRANPDLIESECTFFDQRIEESSPTKEFVRVDYTMLYISRNVDVSRFPEYFLSFNQNNLLNVTQNLQAAGVNATESLQPYIVRNTDAPSSQPSLAPTNSLSNVPTVSPSEYPSLSPTLAKSSLPSFLPSSEPSRSETASPTSRPTLEPSSGRVNRILIGVVAFAGGAAVVMIILIVLRLRKVKVERARREWTQGAPPLSNDTQYKRNAPGHNLFETLGNLNDPYDSPKSDDNVGGLISPNDSLLSNQSLLSTGHDLSGNSGDEEDTTHYLADEFDQYKDQNLERMRSDIEGTVKGVDGMMSQAMTRALMDDEESQLDRNNLYWGGQGDPAEIEATALCEVNDWLKREEGATMDERRAFMQEILNKMVSTVRHGILGPDLASQTIHECAAMLGLQLASELDEASLIVTGMRKTVTKNDLKAGFIEFGEIDNAAVSSNARGFGLVRFESPKAVQRALAKFRREEIVVQDVAVTIKVLSSDESVRPGVITAPSRDGNSGISNDDTPQ